MQIAGLKKNTQIFLLEMGLNNETTMKDCMLRYISRLPVIFSKWSPLDLSLLNFSPLKKMYDFF